MINLSNFNNYYVLENTGDEIKILIKNDLPSDKVAKASAILRDAVDNFGPISKNYFNGILVNFPANFPKAFRESTGELTTKVDQFIQRIDTTYHGVYEAHATGVKPTGKTIEKVIDFIDKKIGNQSRSRL